MDLLLIPYGLDPNNTVVFIEDAKKGVSYRCVACGEGLTVKNGQIKRKHFAHKSLTNCGGGTGEGFLHKMTKTILYSTLEKRLINNQPFNFSWECRLCGEAHTGDLLKKAFGVSIEKNVGSFRPDISIGSKDKVISVIEIAVTHYPTEDALTFYDKNNIPVIVYSVSNIQDIKRILSNTKLAGLWSTNFNDTRCCKQQYNSKIRCLCGASMVLGAIAIDNQRGTERVCALTHDKKYRYIQLSDVNFLKRRKENFYFKKYTRTLEGSPGSFNRRTYTLDIYEPYPKHDTGREYTGKIYRREAIRIYQNVPYCTFCNAEREAEMFHMKEHLSLLYK